MNALSVLGERLQADLLNSMTSVYRCRYGQRYSGGNYRFNTFMRSMTLYIMMRVQQKFVRMHVGVGS